MTTPASPFCLANGVWTAAWPAEELPGGQWDCGGTRHWSLASCLTPQWSRQRLPAGAFIDTSTASAAPRVSTVNWRPLRVLMVSLLITDRAHSTYAECATVEFGIGSAKSPV